jgi:hypothetical protein
MAGSIFGNPLDASLFRSQDGLSAILRVLGKLPDIHMFAYHLGFHPASRWGSGRFSSPLLQPVIDAFLEVRQATGKPVLLALRPAADLSGMKDFLATQEAFVKAGFPVFYSLRQMAKAVASIVTWNQARRS